MSLVELTPWGPKNIAIFTSYFSNESPNSADISNAQNVTGKIVNLVKGKGFTVRYSGTSNFEEQYELDPLFLKEEVSQRLKNFLVVKIL